MSTLRLILPDQLSKQNPVLENITFFREKQHSRLNKNDVFLHFCAEEEKQRRFGRAVTSSQLHHG